MRLIGLSFTCVLACITTSAIALNTLAQTSLDTPGAGPQPQVKSEPAEVSQTPTKPQPCPPPSASTANHSQLDEAKEAKDEKPDRVTHLRRAARHLKAAGELELARRVSKEARPASKLERMRRLQAEVDKLRAKTKTDQTVTLQVKLMELQVAKIKKLGLDLHIAEGLGLKQINDGKLVELTELNRLIQPLRERGLVKVLAEPTIVTVSGRPATFQSGGEFPIVVPQSLGSQSVEYRQFGTRMDCMAEVLENGRIRLELRPTVSEIDTSRSIMIQQMSVPGLRTLSVDTAVEMEAGQTLVLSGMRQRRRTGAVILQPWRKLLCLCPLRPTWDPACSTSKGRPPNGGAQGQSTIKVRNSPGTRRHVPFGDQLI